MLKRISGSRLNGHVFGEVDTFDALECSLRCLQERELCKSINYKARKHQRNSKTCQLNNATKNTHPNDELMDKEYDYYEKVFHRLWKTRIRILRFKQKYIYSSHFDQLENVGKGNETQIDYNKIGFCLLYSLVMLVTHVVNGRLSFVNLH